MIEHWQQHPMGFVHIAVALAALAFGTAVVLSRKGTRAHPMGFVHIAVALAALAFARASPPGGRGLNRPGAVDLIMMLALNGTALAIYELFGGFGLFHWVALFSLGSVVLGYWPAWRKSSGAPRRCAASSGA